MRSLAICLTLIACSGEMPEVDTTISAAARAQPFPKLGPLDDILAQAAMPSRAEAAQNTLLPRGAGLAGRSIAAPSNGSLESRGQQLRVRAAQLRAVEI